MIMGRVIVPLALLMALIMPLAAYAQTPQGAEIEFQSKVIDLGELSQSDDKQIVRLAYTNAGDVPLVVTEVRTSCSCTTVKYSREKVMPGERGTMTITMEPAKAPEGSFYRVLSVYSTARSGVAHITLKAEIIN